MSYLRKVEQRREADRLREQRRKERDKAKAPPPPEPPKAWDGKVRRKRVAVLPDTKSSAYSKLTDEERKLRRLDRLRAKGYVGAGPAADQLRAKLLSQEATKPK